MDIPRLLGHGEQGKNTPMDPNILTQLGVSWQKVVIQLLFFLVIVAAVILAMRATKVSIRTFRGAAAPLWILVCWLLPVIGPIGAIAAARRQLLSAAHHS